MLNMIFFIWLWTGSNPAVSTQYWKMEYVAKNVSREEKYIFPISQSRKDDNETRIQGY